jgi:hypothetical protein
MERELVSPVEINGNAVGNEVTYALYHTGHDLLSAIRWIARLPYEIFRIGWDSPNWCEKASYTACGQE